MRKYEGNKHTIVEVALNYIETSQGVLIEIYKL